MKRKDEIQYIRLYTEGSAARSIDFSVPVRKNKTRLPKVHKKQQVVVRLDLVALCGILMAGVLLIMMVAGVFRVTAAQRQLQQLDGYIGQLQQENNSLQQQYEAGYDIEEVEQLAFAIGMIPKEDAQVIDIRVTKTEQTVQPSTWDNFCTFLSELFAY